MLYLIKRETLREVRNIFTFAIINIIIFFIFWSTYPKGRQFNRGPQA